VLHWSEPLAALRARRRSYNKSLTEGEFPMKLESVRREMGGRIQRVL
jgi:hypothetical protein